MEDVANQLPRSDAEDPSGRATGCRWLARLGVGYLIFCFIKGLVWLGIGAGAWAAMRGD